MKLVTISDLHGSTTGVIEISRQVGEVDWLLVSGDITHFGDKNAAREIFDELRPWFPRILAVPGNCDRPEVIPYLEQEGMSLHGKGRQLGGFRIVGVGGGLYAGGHTVLEFTEQELEKLLAQGLAQVPGRDPLLLLLHNPPFGTKVDRVNQRHVGSHSIRKFIETHRPLVAYSGHIHEAAGKDQLQSTWLVNPGPLRYGGYVFTELAGRELKRLELRDWRKES